MVPGAALHVPHRASRQWLPLSGLARSAGTIVFPLSPGLSGSCTNLPLCFRWPRAWHRTCFVGARVLFCFEAAARFALFFCSTRVASSCIWDIFSRALISVQMQHELSRKASGHACMHVYMYINMDMPLSLLYVCQRGTRFCLILLTLTFLPCSRSVCSQHNHMHEPKLSAKTNPEPIKLPSA